MTVAHKRLYQASSSPAPSVSCLYRLPSVCDGGLSIRQLRAHLQRMSPAYAIVALDRLDDASGPTTFCEARLRPRQSAVSCPPFRWLRLPTGEYRAALRVQQKQSLGVFDMSALREALPEADYRGKRRRVRQLARRT